MKKILLVMAMVLATVSMQAEDWKITWVKGDKITNSKEYCRAEFSYMIAIGGIPYNSILLLLPYEFPITIALCDGADCIEKIEINESKIEGETAMKIINHLVYVGHIMIGKKYIPKFNRCVEKGDLSIDKRGLPYKCVKDLEFVEEWWCEYVKIEDCFGNHDKTFEKEVEQDLEEENNYKGKEVEQDLEEENNYKG